MAVGFSSLGSFSALFTRHVGEPPSSYRRRLYPSVAAGPVTIAVFADTCGNLIQIYQLTGG